MVFDIRCGTLPKAMKQKGAERYEKAHYLPRDLAHRRMHVVP